MLSIDGCQVLTRSVAPSIFESEDIKKGILCQVLHCALKPLLTRCVASCSEECIRHSNTIRVGSGET